MPGKECVKHRNKTYCWNYETGEIDVYSHESVPVSEIPGFILRDLMPMRKAGAELEKHKS